VIRHTLALVLLLAASSASACPICLRGVTLSPAQQIAAADRAVLVERNKPRGSYEVVATIKGDAAPGSIALPDAVAHGTTLLAVRPTPSADWLVVGPVSRERAEVLRKIVADMPADTASDAQWASHVAFMLPYLHDSDPLIESIADGEFERAPYAALRTLRPRLEAALYAKGLDDPSHQALYTVLYGIASGDTAAIDRRIDDARRAKDATNLAALLAADLEIRGPSRVDFIEKAYFADRERTLPEIRAALLALSVHGGANAAVPRSRVIAAYRVFMKERKPMAGFVAHDLAKWDYWDASAEYVQLLKADALPDPASRVAVIAYLLQSPSAQTRAAARALSASKRP